jgi:hypothetical protein
MVVLNAGPLVVDSPGARLHITRTGRGRFPHFHREPGPATASDLGRACDYPLFSSPEVLTLCVGALALPLALIHPST